MGTFGTNTNAVWRGRILGSLSSYVLYFLLIQFGIWTLNPLAITSILGSAVLYVLALFSSSPPWVRWTLTFTDVFCIIAMAQATGGANSTFLMLVPIWFFGVALTNMVDGKIIYIPWMLFLTAVGLFGGAWGGLSASVIAIIFVGLVAMGGAAFTLVLERHANLHDPFLTKLYNRAAGLARLEALCKSGEVVSVAFVDMREFKKINDQHGHKVGDEVLLEVSKRLVGAVRGSDLCVRIGGDEFLVASKHPNLQERLEQIFVQPIQTTQGALVVLGDVGNILVSRQDELDAILERADAAMYHQKRQAKLI